MTLIHIGKGRIGRFILRKLTDKIVSESGAERLNVDIRGMKVSIDSHKRIKIYVECEAEMSLKDLVKTIKEGL